MDNFIAQELRKASNTLRLVAADPGIIETVNNIGRRCAAAIRAGNKILFAGNGGSAADAQHLAAELVSRLTADRPALPAIALTTDTSVLTALANDYGYETVFARQVEALGRRGDVLIAISTSGKSKNILRALEQAKRMGLIRVGLTGRSGWEMATACDYCLRVPCDTTQHIQQAHITLGHVICGVIEQVYFGAGAEMKVAVAGR